MITKVENPNFSAMIGLTSVLSADAIIEKIILGIFWIKIIKIWIQKLESNLSSFLSFQSFIFLFANLSSPSHIFSWNYKKLYTNVQIVISSIQLQNLCSVNKSVSSGFSLYSESESYLYIQELISSIYFRSLLIW